MRIGISGASGQLGAATVAELVRRGSHDIVGISRSPERVSAPVRGRLGDYDRPETLAEAYAGLDRLLIIPTGEMGPGRRAGQSVAAIDAAVEAGVGHIVLMSSAGTRAAEEPDIYASYWTAEQHLIRTAPRWTILRMNYYAEALLQEARMSLAGGVLTGLGENRVAFVSREDVAGAAAGILSSEGHVGAIYNATGPGSLTGAERAALVADASGQPFSFLVLPEAVLRQGMEQAGLPAPIVGVILSIQEKFVQGGFDIVTGDVERLSGRKPRALQDLVREAFSGR
ncbi:SDR family oxidoreductase [Longimicrobium sp.]|jgi:NAD(P)H dehydrogenase (quinone)|uniref:SDR family oxidoreductase n=1 Tax=Longimicrobium sp. TaxID=2029185 RepID=UPI002ED9E228